MNLDLDLAIAKTQMRAKIHALTSGLAALAASSADTIASSLQSLLGFLPSVQSYLRAEWIQYIGLSVTGAAFVSMLLNNGKTKALKTERADNAQAAADSASLPPAAPSPTPTDAAPGDAGEH